MRRWNPALQSNEINNLNLLTTARMNLINIRLDKRCKAPKNSMIIFTYGLKTVKQS